MAVDYVLKGHEMAQDDLQMMLELSLSCDNLKLETSDVTCKAFLKERQ
jgi:hypothetical protein